MNQHSPHTQPERRPGQNARPALWKSIHDALAADIAEGRYRPGDKLPTEAALSRRFGVNRHTVRRALKLLADDGAVHARRGAGVFVTQDPTEYPIGKRVRFHQNLRAAGRLPAKEVLTMETRAASADEAGALKLAKGAPVHVYEGLSLADSQPIALFRSVFPAERLPDLPEALTRLRSVTAALAEKGVADYTRAWTRLNAKVATPTQSRHLQLPDGAPLLRAVSLNVDAEDRPLEYGRTWFSGDLVTLTVSE